MSSIGDLLGWVKDRRGGNNAIARALIAGDKKIRHAVGPQGYQALSGAASVGDLLSPAADLREIEQGAQRVARGQPTGAMDMATGTLGMLLGPLDSAVDPMMAIFAGPLAKNADKAALGIAEQMAKRGAKRDEIWKETGWFKGADDKWRFEIDDSEAKIDVRGAANRRLAEAEKAYGEIEDAAIIKNRAQSRGISVDEAARSFEREMKRPVSLETMNKARSPHYTGKDLAEMAMQAQPADKYAQSFMFSDVADHPALFSAHPDVARTPLDVGKQGFAQFQAAYDADNNRFMLQKYLDDDPNFSLGHEAQHWIQDKEGFASGGNAYTTVMDEALPLEKRITEMRDAGAYAGFDPWFNSPKGRKHSSYNDAVAAYIRENPQDKAFQEINALQKQKDALEAQGAKDYRRLAGEVESRNVQTRRNMTPAERRAKPPWATQDVPDAQQIVRFGK